MTEMLHKDFFARMLNNRHDALMLSTYSGCRMNRRPAPAMHRQIGEHPRLKRYCFPLSHSMCCGNPTHQKAGYCGLRSCLASTCDLRLPVPMSGSPDVSLRMCVPMPVCCSTTNRIFLNSHD